jgi:hypothetical protein
MRRHLMIGVASVSLALGSLFAQSQKALPTKELMRQKLEHSQSVLEGLALENFELVANHARKLSALSLEAGWRALDDPEYARHSDSFRRNVNALAKAGADQNLDGATLAYVRVTMSCVECHKFVRGKKGGATRTRRAFDAVVPLAATGQSRSKFEGEFLMTYRRVRAGIESGPNRALPC